MNKFFVVLGMFLSLSIPAFALGLETPLPDAAQEARAQALFHKFRCVVCQGEAIADSAADVAADMRREIRRQIAEGKSDDAISAYFVSQYGDFILMRPPLNASTLLLWLGPLGILGLAALLARKYFRTQ